MFHSAPKLEIDFNPCDKGQECPPYVVVKLKSIGGISSECFIQIEEEERLKELLLALTEGRNAVAKALAFAATRKVKEQEVAGV